MAKNRLSPTALFQNEVTVSELVLLHQVLLNPQVLYERLLANRSPA